MFQTKQQQLILIGFLVLVISIPFFSFLISKRLQVQQNSIQNYDRTVTTPSSNNNTSLDNLRRNLSLAQSNPSPSPVASDSADMPSYGPSLSFAILLEGRPANQEQSKVFVGIAPGQPMDSPQYLLSYTVDVPSSGKYNNLSLVGLTQGNTYTAYLKGPAQLVSAQTFVMNPAGVTLNQGQPITLLTGDLNEDNVIDSSDLAIAQSALGSTSKSPSWNANVDFNLDGVINLFDLAYINKNLNKIGDSGKWYSKIDAATASASLNTTLGIGGADATPSFAPNGDSKGHWVWVPDLSQ